MDRMGTCIHGTPVHSMGLCVLPGSCVKQLFFVNLLFSLLTTWHMVSFGNEHYTIQH